MRKRKRQSFDARWAVSLALALLAVLALLVARWQTIAATTIGAEAARVWWMVRALALLALAGLLARGIGALALYLYDGYYTRWLERRHDALGLEERRADLEVNRVRVLMPDAHGRQGIAFDGRVFRDLDSKAAYTMEENLFLSPVLERLNAMQKTLTALWGAQIHASDVGRLTAGVEAESAPVQWPTRVPLRGLLDGAPSFRRVVLGVTMHDDGAPEIVQADMATLVHIAVGGSSGWGKSVFLRALGYQLAKSTEPVNLAMVDLEGATLAPFATCERLLWPIADSERDAGAIVRALTEELDRRRALFAEYPGVDSLYAYNDRAPEPLAPIVAIIDEATALLENKEIEGALRTLALRARKFGLWLVLAGQDWRAASLDTAIRNQLSTRVQFKAMSASQSRVLLQQGGAEVLDAKGRALAWIPGRDLVTLQAPIIGAEDIAGSLPVGGPRAAIPAGGADESARIRELAEQGVSRRQIELAVFGYAGGAAHSKVAEVLGATTVAGDATTDQRGEWGESATVVAGASDAMG